jgi:hypothetical protein
VVGTLGANLFGTAWFFWRLHSVAPFLPPEPWRAALRPLGLAALAGGVALGAGWLGAEVLPRFVALVPVGLAGGLSLAGYLAVSLGLPLRPSALRRLVGPQPTA